MGLSIYYSGTIRHPSLIDKLMAEGADICQGLNWSFNLFNGNNADKLKGICFGPENCEPIFLSFLPNGRMCSPVSLMFSDIYKQRGLDDELMYTTATKTQFAGPDAHMAIIKLLHYFAKKYFSVFKLSDEGMYWETGDPNVLLRQFSKYDFLINAVGEELSKMKAIPGETTFSLADRIEKMLLLRFPSLRSQ